MRRPPAAAPASTPSTCWRRARWIPPGRPADAAGGADSTADGVADCRAVGGQGLPEMSPGGARRANITWGGRRLSGHYHLYPPHLLACGAVDPAGAIAGHALGTGVGDQRE